jgi:hypothetical protein
MRSLNYHFIRYKTAYMKKNMGITDRGTRLILATVFIALTVAGVITGVLALVLMILGVAFVLTSIAGFCPLYGLFGINTCKTDGSKQ